MKKQRIRKLAILYFLSSMLLTGCNKSDNDQAYNNYKENMETTEVEYAKVTEEQEENKTLENIISEYNNKTNKNIDLSNIFIEEFPEIKYLWKDNKGNYIYDYRINFNNNQELEYCDTSNTCKMYAVILKNSDQTYEPITGLYYNGTNVYNVKITYLFNQTTYNSSQNYILIENPSKDNIEDLKNGDEYIDSSNKKLTLTKDSN